MNQFAQEYITEKLTVLYNEFKDLRIRYEYNTSLNVHLIEILPLDVFENNENYVKAEMKLEKDFERIFGEEEEILFISEDSLNEITNPIFDLGYDSDSIKYILEVNVQIFREPEFIYVNNIIESGVNEYALAA